MGDEKMDDYERYCTYVEDRANAIIGSKMINWRDVEFPWAENHLAFKAHSEAAMELIEAAKRQLMAGGTLPEIDHRT
jgi:hypothetical protein